MKKFIDAEDEEFVIYDLSDVENISVAELISHYVWNQGKNSQPNRDLILNLLKTKDRSEINYIIEKFKETELPLFVQSCLHLLDQLDNQ